VNLYRSGTGDLLTIGRTALLALLIAVSSAVRAAAAEPVPRVDHIVVVILENRAYTQIIRNEEAPFINELAGRGAMFVNSRAIRKPSQPNYLALFSGSTQGVKDDKPHSREAPTLATALAGAANFAGYAEKNQASTSLGDIQGAGVVWTRYIAIPRAIRPIAGRQLCHSRRP
jgi:acid phosphatase